MDLDFFKIEHNNEKPDKGKILISEPFLGDIYFKRSIVLITEHNNEGTVGFVLNKPVGVNVTEVLNNFPGIDAPITMGGPVGMDSIYFLHTLGGRIPNSLHVFDNVYWGGDFDYLKKLIEKGEIGNNQIRFFVGYSGWEPKQLDREISENSWLVANIDSAIVMRNYSEDMWKVALQNLDKKYRIWSNYPENPLMN